MKPPIKIEDLELKRDKFRLNIDSWKVEEGQIVGLIGRNGAGKTTLLQTLYGLGAKPKGRVTLFGDCPFADPVSVRRQVGYMADDIAFLATSVRSLLSALARVYPTWDSDYAESLLKAFSLPGDANISKLSKGQATALRLVCAAAYRPKLLLLDEPGSGLDLIGRREMLSTLLEAMEDGETSIVISSHALHDVERIADRLTYVEEGKIVRDGRTDELIIPGRSLNETFAEWSV